jgi:hypothetical protein
MYTPIIWANPYELKHLQEKRKKRIDNIESIEVKTSERKSTAKLNVFDVLFRSFAFSRLF